jgi:hypothetical protein
MVCLMNALSANLSTGAFPPHLPEKEMERKYADASPIALRERPRDQL